MVIGPGTENVTQNPTENQADRPSSPSPAKSEGAPGSSGWVQAGQFSYLGLFFGIAILIGCLFGRWLDHKFGTQPWLMMVGVLFGIAASFKELYRVTMKYRTEQKKNP